MGAPVAIELVIPGSDHFSDSGSDTDYEYDYDNDNEND